MAKKFKCVSHVERLNDGTFRKGCKSDLVESSTFSVTETVVVDGRVCNVTKQKTVDPREFVNKFKVSDFTIENLQASGAIASLKEVQLDGYTIDTVDGVSARLDALDKNISSEN